MKNKTLVPALIATFGLTSLAQSATITWSAPVDMYALGNVDTWVSTNGTSVVAFNGGASPAAQTVNGVTFVPATQAGINLGITGGGVTVTGNFASGAGPTTFGDGEFFGNVPLYNTINSAVYNGNLISMSGLVVGQKYEMQILVNDARGGTNAGIRDVDWEVAFSDGVTSPATTIAATASLTNRPVNDSSSPDLAGDYIIGTFTADAMTQNFHIAATRSGFNPGDAWANPNGGQAQFNAFQLRAIPEPSSVALVAFGALGFGLRRRR